MTNPACQPHQQRCETCENLTCKIQIMKHDKYSFKEVPDYVLDPHDECEGIGEFVQGISSVGCASHSSQPVPEVSAVDRFNRAMISGQTISKEVDVGISFSAQELTKRDAAIRKAERERVLDTLLSRLAITLGTGYAEDEKLWYEIEHMAESLRGGELG